MRKLPRYLLNVFVAIFIGACLIGCAGPQQNDRSAGVRAGLAEIEITPPLGGRMAGYFEERLATGIQDPLMAKAIVLEDGSEKIALVSCDLVGLSLNVSMQARQRASARTGIPVRNILIAATHSHTGPLFDDPRANFFHQQNLQKLGRDPQQKIDYPKFLEAQLIQVINKANQRLKPAQLDVGIARQEGLTFNRRYHMKNGTVAFNPGQLNPEIVRPAGPSDPSIGMLLVRDQNRTPLGGLTIFAMHADTIGGTLYSADYPFYLQETLRKSFGENYVSVFAAGTSGDLNHINVAVKESVKGLGVAERLGSTLGKAILANLDQAQALTRPSFATRSETIIAPLQEISPAQLADAREKISSLNEKGVAFFTKVAAVKTLDLAEKGPTWPMEVQVFRLDRDTALVGLPCEIFVELGLAIKAASPFKKTIVMSMCNDRPSYVPTKKAFAEGSYEVTNARVQPGVGEMLVETALKLLQDVKP